MDSGHLRYTHLREWDKALMALDEKTGFSSDPHQVGERFSYCRVDDDIIIQLHMLWQLEHRP